MGKVEIHGIIGSQPTRLCMLTAKAIGLPYELKELSPMNKTPELKKLNPQQQIPILVDDGFVLNESRAIAKYLVDKYAKNDSLYPKDVKARAIVNARLDFNIGTLFPRIGEAFNPTLFGGKVTDENLKAMQGAMETIEEFLSRNKWIAGPQLTIADIDLSSVLGLTTAFGFDLSPYSKIVKYLEECSKNIPNYSLNEEGLKVTKALIDQMRQMHANK